MERTAKEWAELLDASPDGIGLISCKSALEISSHLRAVDTPQTELRALRAEFNETQRCLRVAIGERDAARTELAEARKTIDDLRSELRAVHELRGHDAVARDILRRELAEARERIAAFERGDGLRYLDKPARLDPPMAGDPPEVIGRAPCNLKVHQAVVLDAGQTAACFQAEESNATAVKALTPADIKRIAKEWADGKLAAAIVAPTPPADPRVDAMIKHLCVVVTALFEDAYRGGDVQASVPKSVFESMTEIARNR